MNTMKVLAHLQGPARVHATDREETTLLGRHWDGRVVSVVVPEPGRDMTGETLPLDGLPVTEWVKKAQK